MEFKKGKKDFSQSKIIEPKTSISYQVLIRIGSKHFLWFYVSVEKFIFCYKKCCWKYCRLIECFKILCYLIWYVSIAAVLFCTAIILLFSLCHANKLIIKFYFYCYAIILFLWIFPNVCLIVFCSVFTLLWCVMYQFLLYHGPQKKKWKNCLQKWVFHHF